MPGSIQAGDLELRQFVYDSFVESGRAPTAADVAAAGGGEIATSTALGRLHDAHLLVLDSDDRSIRMALPFSASDVGYTVRADNDEWWANCAWDALGVPIALRLDASIDAQWSDDGTPVDIRVVDGQLNSYAGFVHFTIPARSWWENIVET